jgi:hypothetical protein
MLDSHGLSSLCIAFQGHRARSAGPDQPTKRGPEGYPPETLRR